jgi:hypothetical protein
MRNRTVVHIDGPAEAGKTTFIERVLGSNAPMAICARTVPAVRSGRKQPVAERDAAPAELARYKRAGAIKAGQRGVDADYSIEEFFTDPLIDDYSESIIVEGSISLPYTDLRVFVAPAPASGETLLHRTRERPTVKSLRENPRLRLAMAEMKDFLGPLGLSGDGLLDDLAARRTVSRSGKATAEVERWGLNPRYRGIEHAGLVVVNIREASERAAAEAFVAEVHRLRKDEAVFKDVMPFLAHRIPVTALVAHLGDAKDAGTKKAVARALRGMRPR